MRFNGGASGNEDATGEAGRARLRTAAESDGGDTVDAGLDVKGGGISSCAVTPACDFWPVGTVGEEEEEKEDEEEEEEVAETTLCGK